MRARHWGLVLAVGLVARAGDLAIPPAESPAVPAFVPPFVVAADDPGSLVARHRGAVVRAAPDGVSLAVQTHGLRWSVVGARPTTPRAERRVATRVHDFTAGRARTNL